MKKNKNIKISCKQYRKMQKSFRKSKPFNFIFFVQREYIEISQK